MTLPRYERYKDSGVEWLGVVPAHWDVLQLRRVIDRIEQGWSPECENRPAEAGEWGVLKTGCVNGGRFNPLENKALPNHLEAPPELEVIANDLLMSRASGSPELVGSAALVNDTPSRLLLSDKTFRLHVNQRADKQFLAWCLGSRLLRAQIECAISGAAGLANNLPQSSLVEFVAPFPPRHEQLVIAAYLDRETAKIDTLIAEQQRLIELLTEKRWAVIAQGVTKGLNPSAPMNDSGVEWLGEVPTHWYVGPLRRAFSAVDYGISDSLNSEGAVAVLRMGNICGGAVDLDDLKFVDSVPADLLLKTGDLLFNRTNSLEQIGKVGLFKSENAAPVSFASYLVRLRTVSTSSPKYFAYLLNCAGLLGQARANAIVAIGQCNLNPTRYGAFTVPIPPSAEQEGIAVFLDEECGKLDRLTEEVEAVIRLLRERRTALISAAVTGQIEVRGTTPLETALTETAADIAAGRYVQESAADHVARVLALARADDSAPPSC